MSDVHHPLEPLDGRQLRTFITLAKTGSFTQAGRELSVTQSAVSHAMKALERDIGCRLFDRLGKKVHLTPAGEHFLHHAERIVGAMTQARTTMGHLEKWGQTHLRIGASAEASQHILPSVLQEVLRNFPQILLTIEPCDDAGAKDLLEGRRIDLALTLRPEANGAMQFEPVFSDELALFVGPDHPWVRAGHVARADLESQPFLRCCKGSRTDRLIDAYFKHENITLNSAVEVGSMEAVKTLATLGVGVGVLPPWVARRELREGSLAMFPLGKRKLKRYWGILHPSDLPLTLAQDAFLRSCRERCEALGLADSGAAASDRGSHDGGSTAGASALPPLHA
ncbi:MAG: LysR family transcriptional regulator [Verrucomicrobia bacterium]|nr:LysR family transcriptional regulator [Verrucomicrobiota bacterium]MBI3868123.1 LysR family transcriptional regulator [Verrucomicrobiota bacterium]